MNTYVKPAKRPDLDNVLLCLLRMHADASGYQLRGFIDESTGYLYRAHLSQIYPSLKRLREGGMVTCSTVERDGKPDLKLYRVTERGIEASEAWLTMPFTFERTRDNADFFFMKIVFMGHLAPQKIIDYLDSGIQELQRQRDQFAENNLKAEISFLTEDEGPVRDMYQTIWENELSFTLSEYDLRIQWLRNLRDRIS